MFKNLQKIHITTLDVVLFMLLLSIFVAGCGSGQYYTQADHLTGAIGALLKSEGFYTSKNDYYTNDYVFWAASTGVYISVYGIHDQRIIKKIVELCLEAHAENPGIHYELVMYSQRKEETLRSWKPKKKILELILEKST